MIYISHNNQYYLFVGYGTYSVKLESGEIVEHTRNAEDRPITLSERPVLVQRIETVSRRTHYTRRKPEIFESPIERQIVASLPEFLSLEDAKDISETVLESYYSAEYKTETRVTEEFVPEYLGEYFPKPEVDFSWSVNDGPGKWTTNASLAYLLPCHAEGASIIEEVCKKLKAEGVVARYEIGKLETTVHLANSPYSLRIKNERINGENLLDLKEKVEKYREEITSKIMSAYEVIPCPACDGKGQVPRKYAESSEARMKSALKEIWSIAVSHRGTSKHNMDAALRGIAEIAEWVLMFQEGT